MPDTPIASSRFKRDRRFLYAGTALLILITITLALAELIQQRRHAEASAIVTTQNLVQTLELNINSSLEQMDIALQASADEISRQIASGKPDAKAITRYLERQKQRIPQAAYIRATDAHGNILYGPGLPARAVSQADRNFFIQPRGNPNLGLFVEKPVFARINQIWVWPISRRINHPDGSFAGIVFASIPVTYFENLFASIQLGDKGVVALRDAEMGLIARYPTAKTIGVEPGDRRISTSYAAAIQSDPQQGSFVTDATTVDSVPRTSSFRRSPYGFTLSVGVANETKLAEWRKLAWVISAMAAAFVLALLLSARLICRGWQRQEQDMAALLASQQELAIAKEAAETSSRAKSAFLDNMSHEFRTPMNAVLGMLYLSLQHDLPAKLRSHLLQAQEAANALLNIINGILDLSRIEAGTFEIEHIEFDLDDVLKKLADSIQPDAGFKGIKFIVHRNFNIPATLNGDPLRLGQVLQHVCSNAVKFTERGSVELTLVALNVTPSDCTLQVFVRDTGIGMTAETRAHLFEKFSQADASATRRYGGAGLGLAISRNLVELMGGRIWIESSLPGQGTTLCFTVQLKVAAPARQPDDNTRTAPRPQPKPATGLAGAKILLAEDNDINLRFLAQLLSNHNIGYDTANNGEEALAKVQQHTYDAVLMDIQMPVMSGLEATRHIRALAQTAGGEHFATLPIIALTALGMPEDIEKCLAAGMNGHIAKPVSPGELLKALAQWIQLPATAAASPADIPPDLLALTSLNTRDGVYRIGGKAEAYRKQLRRFREHYAHAVTTLQQLGTTDLKQAEEYCHALKGVTGTIGADALYKNTAEIHAALRRGETPSANEFEAMNGLLQAVIRDIDSLATPATASVPFDNARLREQLVRLEQALKYDLGQAEPLLAKLRSGVRGTPLEPEMAAIDALIDVFDIDTALTQLNKLQNRLNTAS